MDVTAEEPIHYYSTLPEDREPRIAPGTRVVDGQLTVIAELDRGGMAIVYRALDHRRGGMEVVLKVVNVDADPTEMAARFRNEARLARSLAGHPGFVRPLQVGELDGPEGFEGRTYLVTELLKGVSLAEVMSRHHTGLPMQRACTIAREVACALVELHSRGIIHRDVKPGNIVVSGAGDEEHACLIDFGLAFATGDGWETRSPDLTTEGHAPGTPLYMSPQQLAHERPAPAFDVYSLGVMLYELFSGNPPNDRIPLGELIARKCDPHRTPFPIGKMCPELPTPLAEMVGRCMSFEPSARPTAAEVVGVLDEVMEGEAAPEEAPAVAPSPALELAEPAPVPSPEVASPTPTPEMVSAAAPTPAPQKVSPVAAAPEMASSVTPSRSSEGVLVSTVASPSVDVPAAHRGRGWMLASGIALAVTVGAVAFLLWPGPPTPRENPATKTEPAALASAAYAKAGSSTDSDDAKASEPDAPAELDPPALASVAEPEQPPPEPSESAPPRPPDQPGRSKPAPTIEPKDDRCAEDVAAARQAAGQGQWERVVRLTKKARCWKDAPDERIRLRARALFQTNDYAACAKLGEGSSDGDVVRLTSICKARAGEQGSTP